MKTTWRELGKQVTRGNNRERVGKKQRTIESERKSGNNIRTKNQQER